MARTRSARDRTTDKALAAEVASVCTRDIYNAQLEVSIAELEAERAKKKTGMLAGCRDGSPKQARIKLKELPKLDAAAKTLVDRQLQQALPVAAELAAQKPGLTWVVTIWSAVATTTCERKVMPL